MKKTLKNPVGIALFIVGNLLLVALPAAAGDISSRDLEATYEAYIDGQEYAEKIAEIEANKEAFVQEIATKWEAEALERGNDETWFDKMVGMLSEQDAETLLSKSEATSYDMFIGLQTTSELVYYPLTPCRIVDTRYATRWGYHIPIPSGSTWSFDTWGPLSGQGGQSDCGVSGDAAGVVINVAAIPKGVSTGNGWLVVWPWQQSRPLASSVNYNGASTAAAIANATVQSQCHSCSDELNIYVSRTTHVAIDVTGYFAQNTRTALDNLVINTSQSVPNNTVYTVESPNCPAGWRLTGGGCNEQFFSTYVVNSRPNVFSGTNTAIRWVCQGYNNSGQTATMNAVAVCSRIPGR